jgi:hypothetical protein
MEDKKPKSKRNFYIGMLVGALVVFILKEFILPMFN